MEADAAFTDGDRITIVGLKSAPHRNGVNGIIKGSIQNEKGRWNVELDNGDVLSVLPANLRATAALPNNGSSASNSTGSGGGDPAAAAAAAAGVASSGVVNPLLASWKPRPDVKGQSTAYGSPERLKALISSQMPYFQKR